MQTLRAVSPLRIGDVTLVLVERTDFRTGLGGAGCWTNAYKEPYAVVVRDADGLRALAADSSEIPLDALMEKVPGLEAILSELSGS